MIRFVGGDDGRVFMIGKTVTELGVFNWGSPSPECSRLSHLMLSAILTEDRASRVRGRFMHRLNHAIGLVWVKDKAWTFSDEAVMNVVESIEAAERDMAPMREQMSREKPRVISDATPRGVTWDSDPTIVPNKEI
jgi:hypothetical protein